MYQTNPIIDAINCQPIDSVARRVVGQEGCADDWKATVRNLKEINDLLVARHREMRKSLGILNMGGHLTIRRMFKEKNFRGSDELKEYMRIGQQINRINKEYARILKANGAELSNYKKSRIAKAALNDRLAPAAQDPAQVSAAAQH
jgi:hypothetical protein